MRNVNFCKICEVQNADNAVTLKISSDANSVMFMQQHIHHCQHSYLVIAAVHHVQQFIAITTLQHSMLIKNKKILPKYYIQLFR